MRRRELVAGLGSAALTAAAGGVAVFLPDPARAQQQRVRRVAVFVAIAENDPETQARLAALRHGLMAAGWIEDRNLHLDYYFAEGSAELAQSVAAEVVRSRPDLIVANGTAVVAALKQATQTIPIVFAVLNDPVGQGLIESLARPGGNITGFTLIEPDLIGKWLNVLTDLSPSVKRSTLIFHPETSPYYPAYLRSFAAAQGGAAAKISIAPIMTPDEIEGVVAAAARGGGGSLMFPPDAFLIVHRSAILQAAQRHALPAISAYRQFTIEGGLVSYGPDTKDIFERSAAYVDRILKGASPSDLPAQSPAKYEFYINLRTAKAMGLDPPPNLVAQADEVIE
jgi:putative ABC transport system substrate-binding protein